MATVREQTIETNIKRKDGAVWYRGGRLNATDENGVMAIMGGQIQGSGIAIGSISGVNIADRAIKTVNLALLAVTEDIIAGTAVTGDKIAGNTIVGGHILANQIWSTHIVASGVEADNIAANAITAQKIGANEIITQNANIANGVIVNAHIANLNADKIKAGTIESEGIVIAVSAGSGDGYIAGKSSGATFDFGNWQVNGGWMIGIDDSDADKAKFFVGNSGGNYMKFDGSNVSVVGTITINNPGDIDQTALANSADAGADVTGDNVAASISGQGSLATKSVIGATDCNTTIISGGKIITGLLTANNIQTGTLTVASGDIAEIVIKGEGYLTFKNAAGTSKGEVYADNTSFNLTSLVSGVRTWVIGHAGVTISADPDFRVNTLISGTIIANSTNYSGNVGTSGNHFASMYSQAYHMGRSGKATKYIQMGTGGNIEVNTDFYVGGALSKASGSFKIDHPLKPKTHWLEHSFVESPDMLNLYTGNGEIKNGEFKIKMPDWFILLNGKNQDEFTYQLTSIGQINDLFVSQEMNDKGEVIFAGKKDGKFSYMITAIRHDKWAENNRVQVETKK